jgi:hypothetical protein
MKTLWMIVLAVLLASCSDLSPTEPIEEPEAIVVDPQFLAV